MEKRAVFDLDRAVAFYTQGLGMTMIGRYESPDRSLCEVFVGYTKDPHAVKIALAYSADQQAPLPTGDRFGSLILQVPDLPKVLERIKANGGKVTVEPAEMKEMSMTIAVVEDPDGHVLELIQFKR